MEEIVVQQHRTQRLLIELLYSIPLQKSFTQKTFSIPGTVISLYSDLDTAFVKTIFQIIRSISRQI